LETVKSIRVVERTDRPRIWLDLDGVFADFDALAEHILKTDNIYKWEFIHGPDAFWTELNKFPNFFGALPMKKDAHILWDFVKHTKPTFLTALPKKDAWAVDAQKRRWVAEKISREVDVVTCLTSDKPTYCRPGDVLVDDRAVNRAAWEAAGGTFVLHTTAPSSVAYLMALGVL
jgi:hypothetical protein